MRHFSWIFIVLLGFVAGEARAQTPELKKWEFLVNAAVFEVRPHIRQGDGGQAGEYQSAYGDDWYFSGRYAASIGHYWTEHLKTEVEYAISTQGSTYLQRFNDVPGNPAPFPYSVESIHRLEQLSTRMVWQFAKNSWVHPYVSGGLVVDRDRHRLRIPGIYQYPPGRTSGPMTFVPETTTAPTIEYRVGVTAGAGAKIYMSQNAFFNTGVVATYAKPAATLSLLAGFGIDF
jgi:hypothetical protein